MKVTIMEYGENENFPFYRHEGASTDNLITKWYLISWNLQFLSTLQTHSYAVNVSIWNEHRKAVQFYTLLNYLVFPSVHKL